MPPFQFHVFCCTNRRDECEPRGCCASKGSEELRDYMKARVKELGIKSTRINASSCLDVCERGPAVVVYPEGIWYTCKTKEDIDAVIEEHLLKGVPVAHLRMFKAK